MALNEYLGSAYNLFVYLAKFASTPPMLALLGIVVLGCIVGVIFHLVGGK